MLVSARLAEKRPTNYNIIIAARDARCCEILYIYIRRQTDEIIALYYIQPRRIAFDDRQYYTKPFLDRLSSVTLLKWIIYITLFDAIYHIIILVNKHILYAYAYISIIVPMSMIRAHDVTKRFR